MFTFSDKYSYTSYVIKQLMVSHVRHNAEVLVQWLEKSAVNDELRAWTHPADTPHARALKEAGLPGTKTRTDLPGARTKMGNCIVPFCDGPINTNVRFTLPAVCFVWQSAMIILFGVFVRYNEESDAHWVEFKAANNKSDLENDFYFRYPSKSCLEVSIVSLIVTIKDLLMLIL